MNIKNVRIHPDNFQEIKSILMKLFAESLGSDVIDFEFAISESLQKKIALLPKEGKDGVKLIPVPKSDECHLKSKDFLMVFYLGGQGQVFLDIESDRLDIKLGTMWNKYSFRSKNDQDALSVLFEAAIIESFKSVYKDVL